MARRSAKGHEAAASLGGGRIRIEGVRDLYDSFCGQLTLLSPDIEIETAPFETRFSAPGGMYVSLTPYSEIFLVSIGKDSPFDIRVSGDEGYYRALDLALNHFLASLSRSEQ